MKAPDQPDETVTEPKPVTKWAPIVGLWRFEDGAVVFRGPQPDQPPQNPYGLCVSDVRFSGGEISATVQFPRAEPDALTIPDASAYVMLGYRSPTDEYFAVGLAGYQYAYTITHFDPAYGWRPLANAGSRANLVADRPYQVRTQIAGQKVILEVDGVRVLERVLDKPLPNGQLGLFAWGTREVTFSGVSFNVTEEQRTAFVVMAFASPYLELYEDVIKRVAKEKEFNLYPYNVGEVAGPGVIIDDIVRGIATAKLVIAEITPPNVNVFYELGYAHALNKDTILLADKSKEKDLPFDVRHRRCIFYENSIGGKSKVEDALRKHLRAIRDK